LLGLVEIIGKNLDLTTQLRNFATQLAAQFFQIGEKRVDILVIGFRINTPCELLDLVIDTIIEISELFSQFEMDDFKPTWETDVGPAVERVIYDLLTPSKIIVYPVPSVDNSLESYTFEAGDSNPYVGGELLGEVTGIDNYSLNSAFGVVVNLSQPGITEAFNSVFGVVTSISESTGTLKIQYSKRPAELTSVDSNLELSEAFDLAMLHLTVSRAFTADIDTNSDALANKHFKLYQLQLARLKSNKAHNQTKGANARSIVRNPYAD
jgi:hypothetical protein